MNSEMTSTYLEERILSASPLELIEILYDAALDRIRMARRNLATGDALARAENVSKVLEILSELTIALNEKEASETATTYSAIYTYLQKRLVEAHSQQSSGIFAETEEMLQSLAENWRGVKDLMYQNRLEDTNVKPAEPAPAAEPRSWNL